MRPPRIFRDGAQFAENQRIFGKRLRLAARRICPLFADKSYTCEPERIFAQVHAPGKNELNLIRACGRELCEAFGAL